MFSPSKRKNYSQLKISKDSIKQTIFNHPEFVAFSAEMDTLFTDWKTRNTKTLKALTFGIKPKQTIYKVSEDVLKAYTDKALMDKYDVYQHLMNYWNEVMQDDCYLIAADGWKAELSIIKQTKSATVWDCDLVPKSLVIDRYFLTEKKAIEQLEADKEAIAVQLTELEENLPDNVEEDDWILNEVKNAKGKITKGLVEEKMKELKIEILKIPASKTKKEVTKIIKDSFEKTKRSDANAEAFAKLDVLQSYLDIVAKDAEFKEKIKKAIADLDKKVIERYKTLSEEEIKQLVVDDKWMANIDRRIKTEFKNITQNLTDRIKVLYERYKVTLSEIRIKDKELETNVDINFEKMGLKIQDILAGKERIPGFTKKWKPVVMSDLGNTFGGLSGKSKGDFQKGQFPYIPFLNIMNNPVIDTEFLDYVNINPDEKQNKALKGDLFFNGSSETPEEVGMCSVLLEDIPNLYLNSFCFGFRLFNPTEVNGIYLSYFFRSKAGRRLFYSLAQGATRYNLSKSNFNKIEFELPDIDEQNAIAKTVADINNQITALINKLEKYKMIKEGMMQNLLTGKIRL